MLTVNGGLNANKDNRTALNIISAPAWVSASQFRGTMSILQTCVVTLVSCIYTVLHLDLPTKTDFWSVFAEKMKFVNYTILMPEVTLYYAVFEYEEAYKLKQKLLSKKDRSELQPQFKIDMRYCFMVLMGGVHVRVADLQKVTNTRLLARGGNGRLHTDVELCKETLRLSPDAVVELAAGGHWIDISEKEIKDKTKNTPLQKILVVVQVLYMATVCVARFVYGLPLTLLELHILAHLICALVIYAFWFQVGLLSFAA
ncbi:hypothetical protein CDD83_1712 [Cordyceps sp. RAO-2017]|nr:hypothetical protein CDD83_1712 [Cordyceps sp. RAO-2017]